MRQIDFKKLIPHISAIVIFFIISLVYFFPVLEGYELKQGDLEKHKSMSHEITSHQEKYDERALWSGNMFGGMPTFMTTAVRFDGNISAYLYKVYRGGLPHPASAVFSSMLGFFILLLCLRINPWLSIIGAITFAFSSYFFIIIEAGHATKTYAIAIMAPILGGFIQTIRGNWKVGMLLIAIFTGMQLYVNHLQITYYLFIVLVFVGLGELVHYAKKKELNYFFKRVGLLLLAACLGVLPSLSNLFIAAEYSAESTRGKSELTIKPGGESNEAVVSSGLDKDYITQWSYGIDETMTLIIPDAKGGGSYPILGKPSEVERLRKEDPQFFNVLVSEYQNNQNAISSYFGNQPIVSGPVYAGILVVFLAILALVTLRNRLLVPLAAVTALTVMLAWGKNFMGLTEFFIDYIPGYNKFRAVAMILLVAEFTLPIMAVLFIHQLIKNKEFIKQQQKKILIVAGVFVAVLGITYLNPSTFIDLTSDAEQLRLTQRLGSGDNQALEVQSQIVSYREDRVAKSAGRSLLILLSGLAILYLFLQSKLKNTLTIALLGVIILGDLWSINKEYVNNEKSGSGGANKYLAWVKPTKFKVPYDASVVDQQILNTEVKSNPQIQQNIQQRINNIRTESKGRFDQRKLIDVTYAELMESTHYRVLNTNARLDQDVKTPYFHKSLGGYHGAKLKKYQELIDFYLGLEHFQLRQAFAQGGMQMVSAMLPSMKFVNFLNTKYIIGPDNTGQQAEVVVGNPYLYGNAWFIESIKEVESPDSAIVALKTADLKTTAIVEKEEFAALTSSQFQLDPTASIQLTRYSPNELKYSYSSKTEQAAVFSEVYYSPGWKAYVNGEEIPFFKANYIFRGMIVPAGSGEIVFKFEPKTVALGETLSWLSFIIMILFIIAVIMAELNMTKLFPAKAENSN